MGVEFRVLGPLEVVVDGAPVALGGRKPRSLLALLLLHANELVPADRALEEIWRGVEPAAAARSLHVYVSSLRKALGSAARSLRTQPGGYLLAVGENDLDVLRFERLARDGRRDLHAGDAGPAAASLREALALWRGPALADLRYEDFAQRAIDRLDELRLAALEDRIEAELVLGGHAEVAAELEALVAEHPLRERFRRQLMLAHYRSGRQADALAAYRDGRRALDEELGLEPAVELRELERAILRQDPALDIEPADLRARRRLPSPATPFVGRRGEVDDIARLLRGDARLLTLTGPGGTGKTRLALQAAHELADAFPHGVVFVGLAALRDPELVLSQIAGTLGAEDGTRSAAESLVEHLAERTTLLLVDNFEQVDPAAPALGALLAAAPGLRLLVTSRQPLRIYGEHEFPVPPLADDEAVDLFVSRAQAVKRGFEPSAPVLELCRRLDRLPLAIELVAARVREISVDELLNELPRRLELAVAGPRDAPARHQTLWATIDWSFELLDAESGDLFARMAVFDDGSRLASALAVAGATAEQVQSLVDRSLLVETGGRVSMLETVREFALERLDERPDAASIRRRHADHFLELALAGKELRADPREVEWMDLLEADRENLRSAFAFLLQHDRDGAARLAVGAFRFWYMRAHLEDGLRAFESLLELRETLAPSLRPDVLTYAASFAFGSHRLDRARTLAEEALEERRRLGELGTIAKALILLGTIRSEQGDHGGGVEALEESVAIARRHGDPAVLNFAVSHLIRATLYAEMYERTRELGEAALETMDGEADAESRSTVLNNLGSAALLTGEHAEAARRFAEALEIATVRSAPVGMLENIESIAAVAAVADAPAAAARLLGASEALGAARSIRLEQINVALRDDAVAVLRAVLDGAELEAEWSAGSELTLEEAASQASRLASNLASTLSR